MADKVPKWRYIPPLTLSGSENMAVDEYLLDQTTKPISPNVIRFYKWKPSTASIGMHQSLTAEIDLEAAKRFGIDVVRRVSGGGAVFHDQKGEITYAVICRLNDLPKPGALTKVFDPSIPYRYQPILEALAKGLEKIGISIDQGRIHCPALLVGGKKISGNAQAIRNNILLQHGTILLHVQPELMYHILKAPEGVSYTKMVQSVRSKVIGLYDLPLSHEDQTGTTSNIESRLIEAMKMAFSEVFQIELFEQPLNDEEWTKIHALAAEKYRNPAWLEKYQ
jgi:lipoate-protein ligase A